MAAWLPLIALLVPGAGIGIASLITGFGAVSHAAGRFAEAGANVTSAFATIAVASSNGAVGVAEEAWHGVDLLDLRVEVEQGAIRLDDPMDFVEFLEMKAAKYLWQVPEHVLELVVAVVSEATIQRPQLEITRAV